MTQANAAQPFASQRSEFGAHQGLQQHFVDDDFSHHSRLELAIATHKPDSSLAIEARIDQKDRHPFLSDQFKFWYKPCSTAFVRLEASLEQLVVGTEFSRQGQAGLLYNYGLSYAGHLKKDRWWLRPTFNLVKSFSKGNFLEANIRLNCNHSSNTVYARLFQRNGGYFAGFYGVFGLEKLLIQKRQFLLGFQNQTVHASLRNENLWSKSNPSSVSQFAGKLVGAFSYKQNNSTFGLQIANVPAIDESSQAVFALKQTIASQNAWIKLRLSSKLQTVLGFGKRLEEGLSLRASVGFDLQAKKLSKWGAALDIDI